MLLAFICSLSSLADGTVNKSGSARIGCFTILLLFSFEAYLLKYWNISVWTRETISDRVDKLWKSDIDRYWNSSFDDTHNAQDKDDVFWFY